MQRPRFRRSRVYLACMRNHFWFFISYFEFPLKQHIAAVLLSIGHLVQADNKQVVGSEPLTPWLETKPLAKAKAGKSRVFIVGVMVHCWFFVSRLRISTYTKDKCSSAEHEGLVQADKQIMSNEMIRVIEPNQDSLVRNREPVRKQ